MVRVLPVISKKYNCPVIIDLRHLHELRKRYVSDSFSLELFVEREIDCILKDTRVLHESPENDEPHTVEYLMSFELDYNTALELYTLLRSEIASTVYRLLCNESDVSMMQLRKLKVIKQGHLSYMFAWDFDLC